jgi:hypothetical protein
MKEKMPEMRAGEVFFQWDNTLSHPAKVVKEISAQKSIQMIDHPSYSTHLASVDFF